MKTPTTASAPPPSRSRGEGRSRTRSRDMPLPEDPYVSHVKPELGPLMDALGLLVDYVRGEGDYLYYRDPGRDGEVPVLDLAGGYGANLLGHGNDEIREELAAVLAERRPFLVQGSRRPEAAELVRELAPLLREETGHDYVFVFSSSGTEAVNLALMHAHLEHRAKAGGPPPEEPALLVLEGGFHGVLTQAVTKRDFPGPQLLRVPPNNPDAIEEVFDRERRPGGSRLMGVLLETIQGEGGVRLLDPGYLEAVRKLCRRDGVPLILDEVQTGMGRTGRLLDSTNLGISGDYVALAKALGGGLTKIGLTLIDRSRWVDGFDRFSTSTYAEDPFSSRAARRAVQILTRDDGAVLRDVVEKGEELRGLLEEVRRDHPGVIREVRGRGLMIGVEFQAQHRNPSHAISMLSESDLLGPFLASYFLHNEGIRIMSPVASPRVLRVQPSYRIARAEMERFAAALRLLCRAVESGDCGFLVRHLLGVRPDDPRDWSPVRYEPRQDILEIPDGVPKVAFLGHFIFADHLSLWDPSFGRFTAAEKETFLRRFTRFLEPKVFRSFMLESRTGAQVGYVFIGLAQTSSIYADAWRARDLGWVKGKLRDALDVARAEGCRVVGFGGFTSIITDNLKSIDAPDLTLTTGNSFTVAAGIDSIVEGATELGIDLGSSTLGVVGALGNIASVYVLMMVSRVEHLVLIGRPTTRRRLERFRNERVPAHLRERVSVSTSMESLRDCDLVLGASNSAEPLIHPEHIDPERDVLICDISIPPDCSEEVDEMPRVTVTRGGLVHAEGNVEEVRFPGVPLERGQLYACMAETALLGLEGIEENFSHGAIGVEDVERIRRIARRHGFHFLGPKLERSY